MPLNIPIGTKSVLFGVHQFLIHPLLVAAAWTKLYGFPKDIRLWVAFFVHDLGYIGKPNMDGEEGESHVEFGANLMRRWFGDEWGDFCLYHSRFYAKKNGAEPSKLCIADKYVIAIEPWWFYLPRAYMSGELWEYINSRLQTDSKYASEPETGPYRLSLKEVWEFDGLPKLWKVLYWHAKMSDYCRKWVEHHKCGRKDNWTKA